MRTATLNIGGREWPVCFSARVVCDCEDRFGKVDGLFEALSADKVTDKFKTLAWLAAEMLDAGARLSRMDGKAADVPPDEDELLDVLGMDDVGAVQAALLSAITGDAKRTVEAEAPKNARATSATPR